VRAVLDPNVLISALLSPAGPPARLLEAWSRGDFELIASPLLLAELRRALTYPKLRKRIPEQLADEFLAYLTRSAEGAEDPSEPPPIGSPDPDDDYLISLAAHERAMLVSGDTHLLGLSDRLPVLSAADFLARLNT
jgi:uncharacterized protein